MQTLDADPHPRSLLRASLATLGLTVVHHVYGGLLYSTKWRIHGAVAALPIALALGAAYALHRRAPDAARGRRAGWTLVAIASVFPVAFIGVFEGFYNHVLKNLFYFGGLSYDVFVQWFPPPTYELPNDLAFEASGIAQVVPAALAAMAAVRFARSLLRSPRVRAGELAPGDAFPVRHFETIAGERIDVPDPRRFLHVQMRRFAGCPVCNLHLRSIVVRRSEIERAGIREIVVFHSTAGELAKHVDGVPLAFVADPDKRLYRALAVESSPRAMLHPAAWFPILRAVAAAVVALARGRAHLAEASPNGGRFGLPADFLVAPDGRIVACHYGEHADDQWSVDELLELGGWRSEGAGVDSPAWPRPIRSRCR